MKTCVLLAVAMCAVMSMEAAIEINNGNCYGSIADFIANNGAGGGQQFCLAMARNVTYSGPIPASGVQAVAATSNIHSFIILTPFEVSNGASATIQLGYDFSPGGHLVSEVFNLGLSGNASALVTINGVQTAYSSGSGGLIQTARRVVAGNQSQSFLFELTTGQGGTARVSDIWTSANSPEPGTWVLFGGGLAVLMGLRRRSLRNK